AMRPAEPRPSRGAVRATWRDVSRSEEVEADPSVRHLLVSEPEHVADLVDDGVADLADGLASRRAAAQGRPAKDRDLRRQARQGRAAVEEWDAAEDPEELLIVGRVGLLVVLVGRLLLDGDDDVLEIAPELFGDGPERLLDVGLEL